MRLGQKRNDKRLDFNASKQKSDKNHDPSKDKAVISHVGNSQSNNSSSFFPRKEVNLY